MAHQLRDEPVSAYAQRPAAAACAARSVHVARSAYAGDGVTERWRVPLRLHDFLLGLEEFRIARVHVTFDFERVELARRHFYAVPPAHARVNVGAVAPA